MPILTKHCGSIQRAEALHGRGSAWILQSQFDKAIADFTEAIRLNPKDSWALAARGVRGSSKNNSTRRLPI